MMTNATILEITFYDSMFYDSMFMVFIIQTATSVSQIPVRTGQSVGMSDITTTANVRQHTPAKTVTSVSILNN